jgi:hypothetical protein
MLSKKGAKKGHPLTIDIIGSISMSASDYAAFNNNNLSIINP